MLKDTLFSQQDKTVNFVFDNNIEAKFVRREQKYFIIYLSSHDGCSKACRFCHLTQTKQTSFNEALLEDYIEQAKVVFEYYSKIKILQGKADIVHFNFMSRGEPLSNSLLLTKPENLFFELDKLSKQYGLQSKFKISTIFPEETRNIILSEVFKNCNDYIYIPYIILYIA